MAIGTNGVFLLNTTYDHLEVWDHLPQRVQEQMIAKRLRFFAINASIKAIECASQEGRRWPGCRLRSNRNTITLIVLW